MKKIQQRKNLNQGIKSDSILSSSDIQDLQEINEMVFSIDKDQEQIKPNYSKRKSSLWSQRKQIFKNK